MTDKRTPPEASAGKSRRKRATPTIDLTATEVPPAETARASAAPERETGAPDAARESVKEPVTEAATGQPAPEGFAPASESNSGKGSNNFGVPLAAGAAGAAAMALLMLAVWLSGGLINSGSDVSQERMAALEKQIQDLQKRPAPASVSQTIEPKAVDALSDRVAAADNAMKALGLALTALNRRNDDVAADATQARQRAEAAEKAVADLRAGLQDVSKAASAGASSADLAPLQQRIAALEQSAKTLQGDVVKATASDKAARLALSAAALRDAVLRGAPFADELAQAQALGADAKVLAPLTAYAAQGVPNEKVLAQELGALLPAMNKTAGAPSPSGGFIERLQANAGQLVRVRPVDAPAGDDASAVLARIEVAAARADIAAALADLGKLTDAQRAPAQGWIARVRDRQAAIAAARQVAADSARSLGSR